MRTRLLYEMFLPEARFPDEKFWDKDGNPIHPEPKGPPPGTRGRTHADVGAKDRADDEPAQFPGWQATRDEDNIGREAVEKMYPGSTDLLRHLGVDPDDVSYDIIGGVLVANDWGEKHGRHFEWDPFSEYWVE